MPEDKWRPSDQKYGVAIYSFNGTGIKEALSLQLGDTVHIFEQYGTGSQSWFRGVALRDKETMGIFPASFIHIKPAEVDNKGKYETVIPIEDPVVKEATYVLREWSIHLKILCMKNHSLFDKIYETMIQIMLLRVQLMYISLTKDEATELKKEITARIDWGNSQLEMDLVPRINGVQIDPDQCSIVKLYRIHETTSHLVSSPQPKVRSLGVTLRWSGDSPTVGGVGMRHVLVNIKNFGCAVGENSDTLLTLYHVRDNVCTCITESFIVRHDSKLVPLDLEKLHNYYGLFCDLTQDDIERDIFLVAHIYRIGRMHSEHSKKAPSTSYRRPWGVGVVYLNLSKLPEQIREYDYQIKVQSCTDNAESSFSSLHENLIKRSQTGTLGSSTKDRLGPGLSISIQLMKGDLNRVRKDNPVVFSKGVTQIQKLGFTDIITPGAVRNDLYVTLHSGEFDRGSKTAQRNIEVKVTVYDAQKQQIENCFNYGCGEPPKSEFHSSVYYHNNKPEWKETIKLSIPIDRFPGSHILFQLFHCSVKKKEMKKPFGFAHMKVTNEENIVQKDTTHYLCVHKLEGKLASLAACANLPSFLDDLNDPRLNMPTSPIGPLKTRNQREYLTISTLLCSSKFTQNGDLLGILSWRQDDKNLMENLALLENIPGDEIMKFLQDVLDSLFSMFSYQSQYSSVTVKDLNQRIFKTLVHIFTLLQHSRFENFQPVLEAYLTDGFSSTLIYRDLTLCCEETVRTAISGNHVVQSVSVFHTLGYTMKFIAQSRKLQMKDVFSQGCDGESEFLKNLEQLFHGMGTLLANKPNQIGKAAQMALLGNLHMVYEPLLQVISEKNLTDFIKLALQNMPKASEIPEDLTKAKLELLQKTVASKVFQSDESRDELIILCMVQIKNCVKDKKHKALAIELLGDILDIIFNLKQVADLRSMKRTMNIQKDIKTVVSAIFDVVMQSAIESSNEKFWAPLAYTLSARKAEGSLVACVLEMLRLMDDDHYTLLMQLHPRGPQLKEFLKYILQLFRHLVQPVYPKDWTVMRMVTNSVIFTAVEYFSEALRKNYMNGDSFDFELWSLYFNLAVAFVTQPSLQLNQYSEAKQEKIKERYHDMRVLMGIQIETSWTSLGANKEQFIPSLIGPFLELTLVPETEVRKATMPIFFDMIESDSKQWGNFERVAKEMIERLDYFITTGLGDKAYKDLFQTMFKERLLDKVESEPALRENGKKFIFSVTDLLERLLDYREVIDGEEHRDKRMHCTFNILNFYDGMKREEMYFRYINKLFELHLLASNYVEAGMTLREYATKLLWSETVLPEELRYCSQSVSSRKEQVYLEIINCFDQGKVWEYGIPLCKELADYYERKFEYKKLSDILRKQASFYNKILEGVQSDDQETFFPRQDPSYYRVAYYGQSFPPFVRNKMFIYRGDECLQLQTIMNHLSAEYPNASFIGPNNQLKESMKEEDQQYIQICSVKPVPTERVEFKDKNVPAEIKSFYNVNEVDTFQADRPFHKGERDPNNDHKTLCIERTTVKTNYKFPGILRWYEVVAMEVCHLNSIQVAMETIKQNTEEIQRLNERCKADPKLYFTQLEMRLNGTIHAAVQGGVTKYHEAFFVMDFELEHPDEYIYLDDLRVLMMSQLKVIGEGLKIHDQLVPPELEPLHRTMVASFKKMRMDVRKFCKKGLDIEEDSLDPDPVQSVYLSASTSSNHGSLLNIRESKMSLVDDVFMDQITKKEPTLPNIQHSTMNLQSISENQLMESSIPPPVPSRPSSLVYPSNSDLQISNQREPPKVHSDPMIIKPDAEPSSSPIPKIPRRKTEAVSPMNHDEPPSVGEPPPPLPSKDSFRQSQVNPGKVHPPVTTSKPKPGSKPPPLPSRKASNYINGPAVPPIPQRLYKSESDLTDSQGSVISKVTKSNKKQTKVGTSTFYDNIEIPYGQSSPEIIHEERGASNDSGPPNLNHTSHSTNHPACTDLSANGEKIDNVNLPHSIGNNHPDTKIPNENRPTDVSKRICEFSVELSSPTGKKKLTPPPLPISCEKKTGPPVPARRMSRNSSESSQERNSENSSNI